ncbi:hypothetical protein ACFX11_039278 [Malus domestica]
MSCATRTIRLSCRCTFKCWMHFLAKQETLDEYAGQTQVILCNVCEKRGTAPFHWLYHKCPSCGSYNTRRL